VYRPMAKEDGSESLRNEIEELREEAAALADRAKRTARQAEIVVERIKRLEAQIVKFLAN
jgi:predicted nuclease with TOPRIM domain